MKHPIMNRIYPGKEPTTPNFLYLAKCRPTYLSYNRKPTIVRDLIYTALKMANGGHICKTRGHTKAIHLMKDIAHHRVDQMFWDENKEMEFNFLQTLCEHLFVPKMQKVQQDILAAIAVEFELVEGLKANYTEIDKVDIPVEKKAVLRRKRFMESAKNANLYSLYQKFMHVQADYDEEERLYWEERWDIENNEDDDKLEIDLERCS